MLEDEIPVLHLANQGVADTPSLTPYLLPEAVTFVCSDSAPFSVDRCFDWVDGVSDYYHVCGSASGISTVCTSPDGRIWQFTQMDAAPDPAHAQALVPQGYAPPPQDIDVRFLGFQPSTQQLMHGAYVSLAFIVPTLAMLWWALRANTAAHERIPTLTELQRQAINGHYQETQQLLNQLAPCVTSLLPGEALSETRVGRYSQKQPHAWQSSKHSKTPYMERLYTERQQSLFLLVDDLLDLEHKLADMLDASEGTQTDCDEITSCVQALLKRSRIFMTEHGQRLKLTERELAKGKDYFNKIQDRLRNLQQSSPIYLKEITSPYDTDMKLYVRGFYELCWVDSLSNISTVEQGKVYLEIDSETNLRYAVINRHHEKAEGVLGKLNGKLTEAGLKHPKLRSDILNILCKIGLILRGNCDDKQTETTEDLAPVIAEIKTLIELQHQYADYLNSDCATTTELRTLERQVRAVTAHYQGHAFMSNPALSSTLFSSSASDTSNNTTNTPAPAASKSPDFQA